MKRARFTEEQTIAVLKEHEAGARTAALARQHGVSEAALCNCNAKFGGMVVCEAKRRKQLEDENARLKKLLAEAMLDTAALRELLSKNGKARRPARRRRATTGCFGPVGASGLQPRGCGSEDGPSPILSAAGHGAARPIARVGQRAPPVRLPAAFILLRREGEQSGVNRIHRLYREEGLSFRKRRARRKAVGTRAPILVEAHANARWSLDFVHDQFANGQRFRILNIVDDVTKECLGAIPDTSISGRRVARKLTAIIAQRGATGLIVSDNGREFTCNTMLAWCREMKLDWHLIAPGKPMESDFFGKLQLPHARRAAQRAPPLQS